MVQLYRVLFWHIRESDDHPEAIKLQARIIELNFYEYFTNRV